MADTNIKTQISRLSGAKSDLATAITAKGVTVPDDTTLDGYAALVEQIDTGWIPAMRTRRPGKS